MNASSATYDIGVVRNSAPPLASTQCNPQVPFNVSEDRGGVATGRGPTNDPTDGRRLAGSRLRADARVVWS
jgi:hypothetical protein